MENFKGILKKKLAFMLVLNGLAVVFIILINIHGNATLDESKHFTDIIRGFQVGIFMGLQITIIRYIVKYIRALRNENELKKLYVMENDKRTKLIQYKISRQSFVFTECAIGTAAVIAGFLNQIVFITLFGVLVVIVLVKEFLKIYYRNKF